MAATVTVQVDEETLSALDALASRLEQSRSGLVNQVLSDWIAFQREQIREIEAGIADADAGRFVSDEEIARIVSGRDPGR